MKGKESFYCKYIKRFLDICCALAAMIAFCWLYAIIAILVRVKLGSPVIFKQPRPGKDERIFNLYKFRTMTDERDEDGNLLPDEKRLTKFGCSLRSSSLAGGIIGTNEKSLKYQRFQGLLFEHKPN